MNSTNPKVAIFFVAFLPQFADPARGSVALQVMVLGGIFALATLLVFVSIAFFSGTFAILLRTSATASRILSYASAVVFTGLALKLASLHR